MRNGILAGGNWIIDHVKLIDAWPQQDTLVSISSQVASNGGSPYNILKNLAKLGASFSLEAAGLVGDDANGRAILDDCRQHRIDTTQLCVSAAAATSYTDVMTVQSTGRRTFFHQRGVNAHLDVAHFDFTRTRARFFHLGYLLLLDKLDAFEGGRPRAVTLLERAQAAGLLTSVDCVSESSERFQAVILPALLHVDVLFANDYEAEKLSQVVLRPGGEISRSAVERAGRALLARGVRAWVVIHFPEAVFACSAQGDAIWQPSVAVRPEDIAGSAGAGDALAAGVLFGLHENWPMTRALQLGVCAAARSLSHPTCSEGIPDVSACLQAGERSGYRQLSA